MRERDKKFNIIYPIKKDPEKDFTIDNINWFNLITGGSWFRLFKTFVIVAGIIIISIAYQNDIVAYQEVYENPCKYCPKCTGTIYGTDNVFGKINLSNIESNNIQGGIKNGQEKDK